MKDFIKMTNAYLANVGVFYIKLHNLHWNVVGTQFKAVHEYLEENYDYFANVLDEVAEYIKMENEYPPASLKDYLDNANIFELESKDYSIVETLRIVLDDIALLKNQALELRVFADKIDKFALANMLEEHLKQYDKVIWFLHSMLKLN
jgi:starvation-inducible DNA-binding protein